MKAQKNAMVGTFSSVRGALYIDPGVDGLKRLRLTPKLFD